MSPRPTPEELRKAKDQKKKEMEEQEKELQAKRKEHVKLKIRWEQISSELDGLYIEIDKLYRKAAAEQVSTLTVENVNVLIKDTKEIITADPYIDRIKAFVPAGDNPEYRDVIIILRQLRQGLDRIKTSYLPTNLLGQKSLSDLIEELNEPGSEEE